MNKNGVIRPVFSFCNFTNVMQVYFGDFPLRHKDR